MNSNFFINTISNETEPNYFKRVNSNSYFEQLEQRKMLHRSTSMQFQWFYPIHQYLSDQDCKSRPSIEYVKMFLNRFLTDLANEKSESSLSNSNEDQSNTNFVQLETKCHEISFEKTCESQYEVEKIQETVDYLLPDITNLQSLNFVNKDIGSIKSFQPETKTDQDSVSLVNTYSNKLFNIIIIVEIKQVIKRVIRKMLKDQMSASKADFLFIDDDQNLSINSIISSKNLNETEIVYQEEFQTSLPEFITSTVNIDDNSSFNNLNNEKNDNKSLPNRDINRDINKSTQLVNIENISSKKTSHKTCRSSKKSNVVLCNVHKTTQCGCHLNIKLNSKFIVNGDCKELTTKSKSTIFYKFFSSLQRKRRNNLMEKPLSRNLSNVDRKKYLNRNYYLSKEMRPLKHRPTGSNSNLNKAFQNTKLYPKNEIEKMEGKCEEVLVEISS